MKIAWKGAGQGSLVSECGRFRIVRIRGERSRYVLYCQPFFEAGSVLHWGGTLRVAKATAEKIG